MMALELEQKMLRRNEVQDLTYKETVNLLEKYGKCIMVRPTGFGKTHTMIRIATTGEWDRVLYVYPRKIIKDNTIESYKKDLTGINIKFITYQKLSRYFSTHNDLGGLLKIMPREKRVLIMFDESHFMAAEKWSEAIKDLMMKYPQYFYLGATATPRRPIKGIKSIVDVSIEYFDNIKPFDYTRHMAVVEGVLENPYYVVGQFELSEQFESEALKIINKQKAYKHDVQLKQEAIERLKNETIKYGEFSDQFGKIKKYIERYIEDRDYMKFIVYFPSKETLSRKKDMVTDWFQRAFPEMLVEETVVVSGSESSKSLEKVLNMERVLGKIDLIMCIDMISYGYHVDNLTGEVLLRFTSSDVLYNQQIGRCYSIMDMKKKIIFDFMGNYSIKPLYDYEDSRSIDIIDGVAKSKGLVDDELYKGDFINVTNEKVIDLSKALRTFELDRILSEQAIVRAVKYKNMPREVALKELHTSSEVILDNLLKEYSYL